SFKGGDGRDKPGHDVWIDCTASRPSCPALCRASRLLGQRFPIGIAGTSPAMTKENGTKKNPGGFPPGFLVSDWISLPVTGGLEHAAPPALAAVRGTGGRSRRVTRRVGVVRLQVSPVHFGTEVEVLDRRPDQVRHDRIEGPVREA